MLEYLKDISLFRYQKKNKLKLKIAISKMIPIPNRSIGNVSLSATFSRNLVLI
jgi:hypothetical protein